MNTLDVYIAGEPIGSLNRSQGKISFSYDPTYASDSSSTPLSLSMPLSRQEHPTRVVEPWITNLLSDHPTQRRRLADKFGIRRDSPWELLLVLGRDLPGAVQILPPGVAPGSVGHLVPWDESRIAAEIRRLHHDEAWVDPDPAVGHWSLAGAQGKFALARSEAGWAEPTGSSPSTHILKVGIQHLDQSDVAEFVTMRAAAAIGLRVAHCTMEVFEDQPALVVQRYDRVAGPTGTIRLHQEDFCQILGVAPQQKYQSDGGPSWAACLQAVREHLGPQFLTAAETQLLRWQVFNLLTAATDGHAKNISLLLRQDQRALAPFYDLIAVSLLSDPSEITHRSRLAMSFGHAYDVRAWDGHRIAHASIESAIPEDIITAEIIRQSQLLDDAVQAALNEVLQALPDLDLDLMRQRWAAQHDRIQRNTSYL